MHNEFVDNIVNKPIKIDKYLSEYELSELFDVCKNQLLWKRFLNSESYSKLIYRYSDDESQVDFIEKLFGKLENKFNIEILGLWIDYYQHDNHYTTCHKYGIHSNFLILTLGKSRILNFKSKNDLISFEMKNGDFLYFNSNINKNYDLCVPSINDDPSDFNCESIHLIFFVNNNDDTFRHNNYLRQTFI